ncbi:phage recombination protein Bet [Sebaldella sp. S0638]|uniref:phage recombination protein Bet n=1 Tax=Sebaldella sp. S0638 TaxID=2957809 RepID=UPI00209F40B0|nr:phage recombination protein Bet [Sebaldella sp. S0638]MCP1226613.1 phage recombination protein Bet [Sebaldella sp. S0638]
MGVVKNTSNNKNDQLMKFNVGNIEVKLSPAIVKKYLVNGQGNVTDQEIMYFMHMCKARQLNPFVKEVFLIKYGSEPAATVVARDALEKRAIQNKNYDGKKVGIYVVINETGELKKREGTIYLKDREEVVGAWCTVYRKDWENPVTVEVNIDEYIGRKKDGTPNTNWANKPVTMITKVAKAQALREAFIEDLSGMYEQEEINTNINLDPTPINDYEEAEIIEDNNEDITAEGMDFDPVAKFRANAENN